MSKLHNRIIRETNAVTWRASCTCGWHAYNCHTLAIRAMEEASQHKADMAAVARVTEDDMRVPDASDDTRTHDDAETAQQDDDSASLDALTSAIRALSRRVERIEQLVLHFHAEPGAWDEFFSR